MIKRPAKADDDSDSPDLSELFCSLMLEIDDAVSQGAPPDLQEASLAGLSTEEADRLREARRCLELLYNSRRGSRQGEKGLNSTQLFDVGNPPVAATTQNVDGAGSSFSIPFATAASADRKRLGRFEVIRELGRGGQGIVFLARDPRLNRLVALKVPRPEFLMSPVMRGRFVREGHAAAILTHPNVVTVLEAGQIGPVCYLAQAYVAGPTLADWKKQQPGPIFPRTAAWIMAQLADGVEYAHTRGVLHRDLKPSNVLLDGVPLVDDDNGGSALSPVEGDLPFVPRVTDFGVARMLEVGGQETATGTILGTASYMSPEQASGRFRELDGATDVYSLGAMLYELLTGALVFQGDTLLDTLRLVTTVEPTPPRKLRPDLPRDLEAICLKCLEKNPKARYTSAFELAADLRRFLSHEPTRVRPINEFEWLVRWCRRKPSLAGLMGLLASALFALLAHILRSHFRLEQLVIEATDGRQRAEFHEKLADQNKEWALRRERAAETMAYAADLRLVAESWETSHAPAIAALLKAHVPSDGSPDLRGFEWWLYYNLLNVDTPSKELGTHQGGAQSTAVSPRGDLAASGGSDGVVRLWDLTAGAPAGELRGHAKDHITGLAFSSDGSLLASAGDDRTVRVWDVRQRKQLCCLAGHTDWVSSVTFLGDNATLASAGADRTIIVWDVTNGKEKRRLSGHTDIVRSLAFQRRNRMLFSAGEDGTVRAWDLEKSAASPLVPNGGLENPGRFWVRCLVLAPDENSLLGVPFADQPEIVWDLRPGHAGEHRQLKVAGNARSASIQGAANDPVAAFGLEDSYVRVRRYGSPEDERVLRGHSQTVDAVALSPDGTALVSGSQDGSVRLWNLRPTGRVVQRHNLAAKAFTVALDPSGTRVAVSTMDGETQLLDFQALKLIRRIRPAGGLPGSIAFSPDSATLAVLSPHEPLRLYSAADRPLENPVPDRSSTDSIAFSPNGRFIAIGDPNALIAVDIIRGTVVTHRRHKSPLRDIAFLDDSIVLISSLGGDLCRWSLRDEREQTCVPMHAGELHQIAISPDHQYGAVRGFHQVKIFNPATLDIITSLPDHDQWGGLCFLAGGRTLLVGDDSTRPCLWQTSTWHRMGLLETDSIFEAQASSDGYRLVGARGTQLTAIDARPTAGTDRLTRQD